MQEEERGKNFHESWCFVETVSNCDLKNSCRTKQKQQATESRTGDDNLTRVIMSGRTLTVPFCHCAALRQEGLFRVNGNVRAVETLKQRLEAGEDLDLSGSDSCTVASLIKQFLRDLPGGVVSTRVQQALIHRYHGEGNYTVRCESLTCVSKLCVCVCLCSCACCILSSTINNLLATWGEFRDILAGPHIFKGLFEG